MGPSRPSRDIRDFFKRVQRSEETPMIPSEASLGRERDGDENRRHVPTSQDQRIIPDSEDDLADEDEDVVPIRPVTSRRKRVIPDSDDDLEESDGDNSPVVAPTNGEKRQKAEEPQAGLLDEDWQAELLAAVATSQVENKTAESLSDDEIEDEDYIPSPDDVVEDDDVVVADANPVAPIQDITTQRRFVQILYNCLLVLKSWAEEVKLSGVAREQRPMTLGYWVLLRRLSLELIVSMLLAGIPEEVQAFFEKETWSVEDFLSLPLVAGDQRSGIYSDFATGDLRRKDADNACEAYVGSAKNLRRRVGVHLKIAEKSVDQIPNEHKKSFHYRRICREGVRPHFRKLAAFTRPIERGYLNLLERIFVLLLGTYQYPG